MEGSWNDEVRNDIENNVVVKYMNAVRNCL